MCSINRRHLRTTHASNATLYHPMPSWLLSVDLQLSIKRHHRYHPYHLDITLGTTLVPLSRISQCVDHFDLTGVVLPSGTICQLTNMIDCTAMIRGGGAPARTVPKKVMAYGYVLCTVHTSFFLNTH